MRKNQSVTKVKRIKQALSVMLICVMTLAMMPISAYAEPTAPVKLSTLNSGNTVDFAGKKWIVLNPSTGYLLLKDYDGEKQFDTTMSMRFNPSKESNIGYYLNTDPKGFFNSLNTGDQSLIQMKTWDISARDSVGKATDPASVECKIGLISYDEWNIYSKRFNSNAGFLDNPTKAFWTITSHSLLPSYYVHFVRSDEGYSGMMIAMGGELSFANIKPEVRPALYLSPDIFVAGGNGGTVLSHVSTLSDLKVDGETVTGFNATTTTYDVELPTGTTAVPTVTATTSVANSKATITSSGTLPGATTVLVTAEDGVTTKIYTINFNVNSIVKGCVFNDANNNGTNDMGEVPTAGISVKITDKLNNTHATTTDSSGNYFFEVPAGEFTIETVDLPAGNVITTDNVGKPLTVTSNATKTVDVGYGKPLYTIMTSIIGGGGTIAVDKTTAKEGETVTLTVNPNAGMKLEDGSLKYYDGTTDNAILGTSFIMPSKDVTVKAAFEAVLAPNAANATAVAAAKDRVTGASYTMEQSSVIDEAGVKGAIENKISQLDLNGVTPTVTKVLYTPTVSGSVQSPAGVNGTYTFTVGLSKGVGETLATDTTTTLTMTITATPYMAPTTYSVAIGSLTGGTITASPTATAAGATVQLMVVPSSGMKLIAGSLRYFDGTNIIPISGTSFVMPSHNVTVTAAFIRNPNRDDEGSGSGSGSVISKTETIVPGVIPLGNVASFWSDMTGHWAEEAVAFLASRNIVAGYPDNTFRPDNPVTRAELAVMIAKSFGTQGGQTPPFSDTDKHWALKSIADAFSSGIIKGYNDGTFKPDAFVSREEAAVMVFRAMKLNSEGNPLSLSDAILLSEWAKGPAGAIVSQNIMHGYPDNTFRPSGKITRAEVATILYNALK